MEFRGWKRPWVRALTAVLLIMVMLLIFNFSAEDARASDATSGQIAMIVIRITVPEYSTYSEARQEEIYYQVQSVVRKLAHFFEYALLGLVSRFFLESWAAEPFAKRGKLKMLPLLAVVFSALYAATDEAHQLMVDGRSGQLRDVLIDSSGAVLGVFIASLLVHRVNRKMVHVSDTAT